MRKKSPNQIKETLKRIQSVTVRSPCESKAELAKGCLYSLLVSGNGFSFRLRAGLKRYLGLCVCDERVVVLIVAWIQELGMMRIVDDLECLSNWRFL